MTRNVALFGAGATGTRLAETSDTLTVFDLDGGRVQVLVAKGARPGDSAAEAVSVNDDVISRLILQRSSTSPSPARAVSPKASGSEL